MLRNGKAALASNTQHLDQVQRYKAHCLIMDLLGDTIKGQKNLRGEVKELVDRLKAKMQYGSRQAR